MRKHGSPFTWVALGLLLVTVAALAGTGRMHASERSTSPGESVACDDTSGAGLDAVPTLADTTVGACRMEPQCSTDTDCAAWCPTAGGHCVHSRCPIRICKCS